MEKVYVTNGATGETLRALALKIGEANKKTNEARRVYQDAESALCEAKAQLDSYREEFAELLGGCSQEAVEEFDRLMGYPFGHIFSALTPNEKVGKAAPHA